MCARIVNQKNDIQKIRPLKAVQLEMIDLFYEEHIRILSS